MEPITLAVGAVGCAAAGGLGAFGLLSRLERVRYAQRRKAALGLDDRAESARRAETWDEMVARYMGTLGRRLYIGSTAPLSPSVRVGRARESKAGERFVALSKKSGCSKDVTLASYCESEARFMLAGMAIGAVAGVLVSTELAIVLCIFGALFARSLPRRSLESLTKKRAALAQRSLSEMLEVVALGMRSGLTFDRSFALYGFHFENEFALSCAMAYKRWTLGLSTREEALSSFAESYECEELSRIVDTIVRGLRFGTSMAQHLEEAAVQSREAYRATLAERVAKAPVKMMLPTGTLILPAMLLLVMGPILLELAGGF